MESEVGVDSRGGPGGRLGKKEVKLFFEHYIFRVYLLS